MPVLLGPPSTKINPALVRTCLGTSVGLGHQVGEHGVGLRFDVWLAIADRKPLFLVPQIVSDNLRMNGRS
jgi:hypothetical protein